MSGLSFWLTDVDCRELSLCQLRPDGINRIVEKRDTTHAAAKDVAAILDTVAGGFTIADGAAADVDRDVAVGSSTFTRPVFLQLTIERTLRVGEECAHRSQTAAAVDGAEHGAARNGHIHIAAHRACRQRLARETAATAEDVAVDVRGAPGANLRVGMTCFTGVIADVHFHVA